MATSGTWSNGTNGSGSWKFNSSTGVLTVTGTGVMSSYFYNGTTTSIMPCAPWMDNVSKIKKVVVESGITDLGACAFCKLTNLTNVELPDTITDLGMQTFRTCTSLQSITIPKNVIELSDRAFDGCTSLTSITFMGNGVPKFGNSTFALGSSSKSVTCTIYTTGWGSDDVFRGTDQYGESVTNEYTTFIYDVLKTSPEIPVNVSGTWKSSTPYVNVGGTWKEVKAVYVNVNGEWKETV